MHRAFLWHIDKDRTLSAEFAGLRLTIEPDPGQTATVHFKVGFVDAARVDPNLLGSGSAMDVKAAMAEAEAVAWTYIGVDLPER